MLTPVLLHMDGLFFGGVSYDEKKKLLLADMIFPLELDTDAWLWTQIKRY